MRVYALPQFLDPYHLVILKYHYYLAYESLLAKELWSLLLDFKMKASIKWASRPVLNSYKFNHKGPMKLPVWILGLFLLFFFLAFFFLFKRAYYTYALLSCTYHLVLSGPFYLFKWNYFLNDTWKVFSVEHRWDPTCKIY